MPPATPPKESWHLEKQVPISIIATILVQSAVIVWWTAKADSRLVALEEARHRAELQFEARNQLVDGRLESLRADRDRLIRMEAAIEYIAGSIRELKEQQAKGGGR